MSAEPAWGVDSEYGRLLDVLLCPPDNFRWRRPARSRKATLEAGHQFDAELAAAQHAELVAAYEDAGVRCHFLEPDPALPYQVFARDSSTMGPNGAVVTQLAQRWRRGEYAPVDPLLPGGRDPDPRDDHRRLARGRRRDDRRARQRADRHRRGADQEVAANQLAGWFREDGWEVRVEPIPERYVHIDVLVAVLGEKLAAVCSEVLPSGSRRVAAREGLRPDRGERGAGLHARRQRDLARRRAGDLGRRRGGAERARCALAGSR